MLAKSIINNNGAGSVLLLTGDTYSKIIDPNDSALVTLFGDGSSATLVANDHDNEEEKIGPFSFGTDGANADLLSCRQGGFKYSLSEDDKYLRMNGGAIMSFTLKKVPEAIASYLEMNNYSLQDFDHILMHQANKFILDRLYSKIGAEEKGIVYISDYGNTVSSSIPCALAGLHFNKIKDTEKTILLVGFGVGLSWGCTWIKI